MLCGPQSLIVSFPAWHLWVSRITSCSSVHFDGACSPPWSCFISLQSLTHGNTALSMFGCVIFQTFNQTDETFRRWEGLWRTAWSFTPKQEIVNKQTTVSRVLKSKSSLWFTRLVSSWRLEFWFGGGGKRREGEKANFPSRSRAVCGFACGRFNWSQMGP